MERALDALLVSLRKKKFAETHAPRDASSSPKAGSRHVPAAVKREVVARDGGRCTFESPDGRRCNSRAWLAIFERWHHDEPFGKGGPTNTANVRLLCKGHNAHKGALDYGRQHMAAFAKPKQPPAQPEPDDSLQMPPSVRQELLDMAADALRQLGFAKPAARRAVGRAMAALQPSSTLEDVVRQSLRRVEH